MTTMFVRHSVSDYAAWKKAYDAFEPTRDKMGVTRADVYQTTDEPNEVTATHDFGTIEAARSFASSPELKSAMKAAGVQGEPTIWFTAKV
ncbi:MAG: cyclase [Planctomycetota bacterium]